jgi:hypothetical protein
MNLGVIHLERGDRGLAIKQYDALKSLNRDLAGDLFKLLHRDHVIDARK